MYGLARRCETAARKVLQGTTGIYAGSVYRDSTLVHAGLRGEGVFNLHKVFTVKSHAPAGNYFGKTPADGRAVVLLRNPLHAALAWLTLEITGGGPFSDGVYHNLTVPVSQLRPAFDGARNDKLQRWKAHTEYFVYNYSRPVLFVKFEDLLKDTFGVYTERVMPFLGIDPLNPTVRARLSCAIKFAATEKRPHASDFPFTEVDRQAATDILGSLLPQVGYTSLL